MNDPHTTPSFFSELKALTSLEKRSWLLSAQANKDYRFEASLLLALDYFNEDVAQAWLWLNSLNHFSSHAKKCVLLQAKATEQLGRHDLSKRLIEEAYLRFPLASDVYIALLRQQLTEGGERRPIPDAVAQRLLQFQNQAELNFALNHYQFPDPIGAVKLSQDKTSLLGWVIVESSQLPISLTVIIDNQHPLLIEVTPPIKMPEIKGAVLRPFKVTLASTTSSVSVNFNDHRSLSGSPVAIRQTTVSSKYNTHKKTTKPQRSSRASHKASVDIIIPVYQGYDETLRCIHSVQRSLAANHTQSRLIIIDDASPDPKLSAELDKLANESNIVLHRNLTNLGFVRSMNLAMSRLSTQDVIWLNADTEVHGNWIDRLKEAAYSNTQIAGASPFSNAGELMSFPHLVYRYPMPDTSHLAHLDTLAKDSWDANYPELEVACGFCLYLKRNALDEIGLLDEVHIQGGYGEDTDWSLRAKQKGWRLLACPNTFVAHQGSVSFKEEKIWRVAANNQMLRQRYPHAHQDYAQYLQRDPIAQHRQALQRARLRHHAQEGLLDNTSEPLELLILCPSTWNHPAIPRCETEISSFSNQAQTQPIDQHYWLRWWYEGSDNIRIKLSIPVASEHLPLQLQYRLPQNEQELIEDLTLLQELTWLTDESSVLPRCLQTIIDSLNIQVNTGLLRTPKVLASNHHEDKPQDNQQAANMASAIIIQEFTLGHLHAIVVADRLNDQTMIDAWLSLAQSLASMENAPLLIITQPGLGNDVLLRTGTALFVTAPKGITLTETLQLARCDHALSLATTSVAFAEALAARLELTLYRLDSTNTSQDAIIPEESTLAFSEQHDTSKDIQTLNTTAQHRLLNLGCGTSDRQNLPSCFAGEEWHHIRIDIDSSVKPDIVSSLTDIQQIPDEYADVVWSSHSLEHLEAYNVSQALAEMYRMLKPDGYALITMPDLQSLAQLVVEGKLLDVMYESPMGPIRTIDMLYGHGPSLQAGHKHMAHRSGLDATSLGKLLVDAGFQEIRIRQGRCYDLWAYAFKTQPKPGFKGIDI